MKVKTTATEAPWSNGIYERHNVIIKDIISKVRNDINCHLKTALAWAISAKKSLMNVSRFNPHQIVLGRNINLPFIYNAKPLADLPQNEIIIEHLSVLHATRQAFTATKSTKKLKTALQKKPDKPENILIMDLKYITNETEIKSGMDWEKLQDMMVLSYLFIRYGGFFIKAHCSRVQLAHDLENGNLNHQIENIDNSPDEENQKPTQQKLNNNKTRTDDSDNGSDINEDISKPIAHNSKKSTSTNTSSEKLKEENTTTLEKLTNKLAAININDNDNESKNLPKI